MYKNKCLEYYFDSRIYGSKEIQQSIDSVKKDFPNREVKASITLNKFGMYVITFEFENKNTYFNKIKIKFKKRFRKPLLLENGKKNKLEKYSEKNRYGQYKSTGKYRPY